MSKIIEGTIKITVLNQFNTTFSYHKEFLLCIVYICFYLFISGKRYRVNLQFSFSRCFVIFSSFILNKHVMLCYVMLCYVMLCYAMLCYAMLCYVMLCYVMLCYVMLENYFGKSRFTRKYKPFHRKQNQAIHKSQKYP